MKRGGDVALFYGGASQIFLSSLDVFLYQIIKWLGLLRLVWLERLSGDAMIFRQAGCIEKKEDRILFNSESIKLTLVKGHLQARQ